MALKFKVSRKEDVPAELQSLYVERNGAFYLDAEGVVEKERLDEFRNNNITLQKRVEELTKSFEGIDAEQARELLKKQQDLEEGELVKKGDIEGIVHRRLVGVKGELEKSIQERAALETKLADIQINQAALTAGTKRGVRASAVPDLLSRARGAFKLQNGNAVAVESDGKTLRYGKDGTTPMSFDEWIDALLSEAPHLFESNSGGGAAGNGGHGASGAGGLHLAMKNPWKKETFNLTEQGKIARQNPGLASQLRRAAGR